MTKEVEVVDSTQAVAALASPAAVEKLSGQARENVLRWLTENASRQAAGKH